MFPPSHKRDQALPPWSGRVEADGQKRIVGGAFMNPPSPRPLKHQLSPSVDIDPI